MLFLRLSEAQSCKWTGICNRLRLSSAALHNAAWCLQRVAANICKLHGLCHMLNQHLQIAWDLQRARSIFGARSSFLSSCRPPSFRPSLPPSFFPFLLSGLCPSFFSCRFSILIPFSFDKFARGSRCKCSMQQVCQLLWLGEQPTALVAAWTEGMSAVASVEAS